MFLFLAVSVPASTPPSGTVTVPTKAGQTATDAWTGTIQPGVNSASDCSPPSTSPVDEHAVTVVVPAGAYDKLDADFAFEITWTPSSPDPTTSDEILTVLAADGSTIGSSDGGSNVERVVAKNLPAGTYTVLACGFANAAPQPYDGKLEVTTRQKDEVSSTVQFAPATVVSAHFLGAEPQTTLERPVPGSIPGRIDPNRIFVDWPLTSRTQTGQLSRSVDGGDSFRLLFDPTCAARNRPTCQTLGGGDTEEDVNFVNGNLFYADQEALVVNEAVASSTDHGDTFPAARQFAITNTSTAADRQWLAWIDPAIVSVAGRKVEAFLAWHLPGAGQYVVGIDQDGLPIAQPAPQILQVSQSGQTRVDNSSGPGRGWIYQPYRGSGGTRVATAYGPNYQNPQAWKSTLVTSDSATIFPWLAIDSAGNAYLVWVAAGKVFLSVSPIADPKNNPQVGGRPGTYWTPKVQVNPDAVSSTVFPEVIAGDAGRIAIAYMGSEDCAGISDDCISSGDRAAHWHAYASIITNALSTKPRPITARVSHRVVHRGSVCTSGTTCTGDRSLLDMIDVGVDAAGRVGVVFMDNNNRLAAPNLTDNAKQGPFTLFAKETKGPSLLGGSVNVAVAQGSRSDAAGDATWPNKTGAANLPALDLLGASVSLTGGQFLAKFSVADATTAGMARDLAAYNATFPLDNDAERLQYVVSFATENDVFHLSMEFTPTGGIRFFGGRLDVNDRVQNGTGTTVGARYVADAGYPVTGSIAGGEVTLSIPASALGLSAGAKLFSVTAFATAAPLESNPTATLVTNSARTVDATPPFDATT